MGFFKKKDKKANFYGLLCSQMDATREGVAALLEYCRTGDEAMGEKVIEWEKEGDRRRRVVVDEINHTYLTPFDREDLFDLSRLVDDVLDYACTTVDGLRLYKITANEDVIRMAELLLSMCDCLLSALSYMEKRKDIAKEEAIKVKKLENTVGRASYESMAKLYEMDDFKYIFKYREIYRHLNRAADIGDSVADLLMNIMVQI